MSRAFEASYTGGRCGICETTIHEGDELCYVDDEVVHASCAEDEGEEVER